MVRVIDASGTVLPPMTLAEAEKMTAQEGARLEHVATDLGMRILRIVKKGRRRAHHG
jgi:hypothetical protein